VSGQATGDVLRYGPDDPQLLLVCVAVADRMNTDGQWGRIGYRHVAERSRCTIHAARRLIAQAVADRWLTLQQDATGTRPPAYQLGAQLIERRRLARDSERQDGSHARDPKRRARRQSEPVTALACPNPRAACESGAQTHSLARDSERGFDTRTDTVYTVSVNGAAATANGGAPVTSEDASMDGTHTIQGIQIAGVDEWARPARPDFAAVRSQLHPR
jgi:hypothetical protein